ncbi:MAG: hypothetical protein F4Z06_05460 [Acidimicrobiia bacterium]|nr:hypothetical protein [Acidimicrobiia bacterium]MYE74651.1 hypothetical protein [Acidimicrobiia bacterium]
MTCMMWTRPATPGPINTPRVFQVRRRGSRSFGNWVRRFRWRGGTSWALLLPRPAAHSMGRTDGLRYHDGRAHRLRCHSAPVCAGRCDVWPPEMTDPHTRTGGGERPRVIIDPEFRTMDEIFDPDDLGRLAEVAEIVWGRDEPMPTDLFFAEIADASAVVFGRWRHGPTALDHAGPGLRALLEVAGGHEHEDLDDRQAQQRGVLVGSCAPAFGAAVAELGLALALGTQRGIVEADRRMRARTEAWLHEGNRLNRSLFRTTIGFVGCGQISVHLQRLLEPFQPILLGYDPPLPRQQLETRGITPATLQDMFDRADIVFVLAAPSPATEGMISRELIARLGPSQGLVVLSRASIVDFDALVKLSASNGFRFATDVYPVEPPHEDDPIRDNEQAILVPHLAGALPEALRMIGRIVVDDLLDLFAGQPVTRMQYLTDRNRAGLLQTNRADRGWAPTSLVSQGG